MFDHSILSRLDIICVALSLSLTSILGIVVFLHDFYSDTNKYFVFFCIVTVLWIATDYIGYKLSSVLITLWVIRLHIFFSCWNAYFFYKLSTTFPRKKTTSTKASLFVITIITGITSILSLSPLVFSHLDKLAPPGHASLPETGIGIILFAGLSIYLILFGIVSLILNYRKVGGNRIDQLYAISGISITISLMLIFNLVFPLFFHNTYFIPFAPLFVLPFIALVSYAILKHHLLNVKLLAVELALFALWTIQTMRLLVADNSQQILSDSVLLFAVVVLGTLLIASLLQNIHQNEINSKLEKDFDIAYNELKQLDEILRKHEESRMGPEIFSNFDSK